VTTTVTDRSEVVGYDVVDGVAVLRIVNPPVNSSTVAVRQGVTDGIRRASADDAVAAVVLIGTDRAFVTGSDLREFDGPLPDPQLPSVIRAIEQSPKTVVAALTGPVLGGGLELALGCDARVAHPSTVVGLPEVSLGMVPGAGGTQRLPRLVGAARAIQIVCSGARLGAVKALEAGIVDAVADGDLLEDAIAHARTAPKRLLIDLPVPADVPGAVEAAAADQLRKGRGRPQVVAAVGAILMAVSVAAPAALRHERAEFDRLRLGREARALRHLFFSGRATAREYRRTAGKDVTTVGVIGAGTMGSGIARSFVDHGFHVVLVDTDEAATARGVDRLVSGWQRAVRSGGLDDAELQDRRGRVTTSTSFDALAGCELVIEAVFEDMEVKSDVLRRIEAAVSADAVIATNTSYLDLDVLAESLQDPTRLVGMHFFSPAHATKVLEIVRGDRSGTAEIATAVSSARVLGKTPIVSGVGFGFIGNRIFAAYRRQCELMVLEGALPHEVDAALQEFGFAMGPFAVADMSGLDIAWNMRRSRPATGDAVIADRLCEAGRFGQKTGAGWYRYEPGSTTPVVDPEVEALVEQVSRDAGVTRRPISSGEIVRRALLAMVNEAAHVVSEGIASAAPDIDVMLTLGYGFPKHEGGPVFWYRQEDPAVIDEELRQLGGRLGRLSDDASVLADRTPA